MTNAQSRFNDASTPQFPFWLLDTITSNRGRDDPNWTWNPSRQAFVNKWGREVRTNVQALVDGAAGDINNRAWAISSDTNFRGTIAAQLL